MEMIRHEGCQIGSKLDQQPGVVTRSRQSEFAASRNQPGYEYAADVLVLACPARERNDEHLPEPPHELSGAFVARLALFEDGAQIGVIDIRKVLGVQLALCGVILLERPPRTRCVPKPACLDYDGRVRASIPHQRIHK